MTDGPIETSHADPAVTEPGSDAQPDTESSSLVDELDVHNGEPLRPSFVDGNGVERIAGPPVENWTPAQVDPTDEQIARNEAMQAQEAKRREEADALLGRPTSEALQEANATQAAELDAAAENADEPEPEVDSADSQESADLGADHPVEPVTPEPVTTPVDPEAPPADEVSPADEVQA